MKQLKKYIKNSEKILLLNHIKMDPDAMWSLWTLYSILKKLWKNVKATNENLPREDFAFLKSNSIFTEDLNIEKFAPDLIIILDTASTEQLWKPFEDYKHIFENTFKIVIDHHITNPWFWDLNIINTKTSSTCELIFEIIEELDWKEYIWKKEATLLMAWIITDTNIFYNLNTTSKSLKTSAKLLDLWADLRNIIFKYYNEASFEKTKLKGLIFDKMQKTPDWKIIWVKITKKDFKKTWTTEDNTSWIIMNLLNITWCEIAFMLYDTESWTKASFRSNAYDVWKLCSSFPWGGWHKYAAWFRSTKSLDEVEEEVFRRLKK